MRQRCGAMAERPARDEPDVAAWATPDRDTDLALLVLRSRRRDPCAERVARELERRRSPAELAAISESQAQTLLRVINAVLDGIGLTPEQRERGVEIAVVELRGVSDEDSR
jgi:hypothetical protein